MLDFVRFLGLAFRIKGLMSMGLMFNVFVLVFWDWGLGLMLGLGLGVMLRLTLGLGYRLFFRFYNLGLRI